MKSNNLKIIAVLILVLAGVGLFYHTSSASIFDFFRNLVGGNATSTQPSAQVMYKPVADYEQAVVDAVKKASPAVVAITISKNVPVIENCPDPLFNNLPPEFQQFFGNIPNTTPCTTGKTQLQEVGGGSGFIVSADGLILTNKHVVADTKASYTVFTNDGKKYTAQVLARDPVQDLAVVKIDAQNLPIVTLGDSSALQLGQSAIAIGNALGEFRNTVSVGVISGLSRTITASGSNSSETLQGVIQTDAAINPGNSGGPLLNLKGEVVGIDTAMASDAQNIGFALPINIAKRDINSVKTSGSIKVAYIGVRYVVITPDIVTQKKLSVDSGALVEADQQGNPAVVSGSPADKAGIKAGDVITAVNGKSLTADYTLSLATGEFNVGDIITLTILRSGKQMDLKVTLAERPQ